MHTDAYEDDLKQCSLTAFTKGVLDEILQT